MRPSRRHPTRHRALGLCFVLGWDGRRSWFVADWTAREAIGWTTNHIYTTAPPQLPTATTTHQHQHQFHSLFPCFFVHNFFCIQSIKNDLLGRPNSCKKEEEGTRKKIAVSRPHTLLYKIKHSIFVTVYGRNQVNGGILFSSIHTLVPLATYPGGRSSFLKEGNVSKGLHTASIPTVG
jgi:hypothetical protein